MLDHDGDRSPTFADVVAAATRIADVVVDTPLHHSETLSALTGADVWVKFENLQFTGSFKDRGAANAVATVAAEAGVRGVLAMSAGNHAQGVARQAQRLGIDAVIVMPEGTPGVKIASTMRLGAEVIVAGSTLEEAAAVAAEVAGSRGLRLVHPYDDPDVIAGQGTVGLEIAAAGVDLDDLLAPVGGGGLMAGVALAMSELSPRTRLWGVRAFYPDEATPAAARDDRGWAVTGTIADGIAVKQPGRLTGPIIERLTTGILRASEASIEAAIAYYLDIEKTVAEGAGAISLAALLERRERFEGRRVGLVVSGGNIDPRVLANVALRGLTRQGRLLWVRTEVRDRPGQLGQLSDALGRAGANIVEVVHEPLRSQVAYRTRIDFLVETIDAEHAAKVVAALEAEGFLLVDD